MPHDHFEPLQRSTAASNSPASSPRALPRPGRVPAGRSLSTLPNFPRRELSPLSDLHENERMAASADLVTAGKRFSEPPAFRHSQQRGKLPGSKSGEKDFFRKSALAPSRQSPLRDKLPTPPVLSESSDEAVPTRKSPARRSSPSRHFEESEGRPCPVHGLRRRSSEASPVEYDTVPGVSSFDTEDEDDYRVFPMLNNSTRLTGEEGRRLYQTRSPHWPRAVDRFEKCVDDIDAYLYDERSLCPRTHRRAGPREPGQSTIDRLAKKIAEYLPTVSTPRGHFDVSDATEHPTGNAFSLQPPVDLPEAPSGFAPQGLNWKAQPTRVDEEPQPGQVISHQWSHKVTVPQTVRLNQSEHMPLAAASMPHSGKLPPTEHVRWMGHGPQQECVAHPGHHPQRRPGLKAAGLVMDGIIDSPSSGQVSPHSPVSFDHTAQSQLQECHHCHKLLPSRLHQNYKPPEALPAIPSTPYSWGYTSTRQLPSRPPTSPMATERPGLISSITEHIVEAFVAATNSSNDRRCRFPRGLRTRVIRLW